MINLAIVDHHPAVRAGLHALLDPAPDVTVVGAAGRVEEIHPLLYRTRPDVLIVEHPSTVIDAMRLARAIKAQPPAPAVLLYADAPHPATIAAAMLCDADGIVDQAADERELLEALRAIAGAKRVFPAIDAAARRTVAQRLDVADHAILAMRLAASSGVEIADTLRIDSRALRERIDAMVPRLVAPIPAGAGDVLVGAPAA